MAHVKFRRWGPYVWWICPSRKCNFENKTDLSFVHVAFETKCQYCNTPVTIKMIGGQLSLESSAVEEEEPRAAASTASVVPVKPLVPSPAAQPGIALKQAPTPSPVPQGSSQGSSTRVTSEVPPSNSAPSAPSTMPAVEAPAEKPESASKSKDTKKKPAR